MLSGFAILLLRLYTLKSASQMDSRQRLRYLRNCHRIQGIMIPVFAILTVAFGFLATCALFPRVAAMFQIESPSAQGISNVLMAALCLLLAGFCGLFFSVSFITREFLAFYWLISFLICYDIPQACAHVA